MKKVKFLLVYFFFINLNISAQVDENDFGILYQPDTLPMDTFPVIEIYPLPEKALKHPYLFFSKTDIQALEIRANHPELYPLWAKIKKDALNPASHPYSNALSVLPGCLAYQISGDTVYANAAKKYLFQMLEEPYNWSAPDPLANDLKYMNWETGDKVLAIAYVYDMVHDQLDAAEKDYIKKTLVEKVFPAFKSAHFYHFENQQTFRDRSGHSDWWTNCYFSWNSHLNGTIGLAALATLWEIPDAPVVFQMARASLAYTFPEIMQDSVESGGHDEGPMQYGLHLADLTRFYAAFEHVLQRPDAFFELEGVKKSLDFIMNFTAPDGHYVPFAGSHYRRVIDPPSELYYLANMYKNRPFINYLDFQSHENHTLPFALLWRPILNDTIFPGETENFKAYRDIHWAFYNDYRMFVPFKGGDNASNMAKLDAGNVLLWLKEAYMLHSPAYHQKDTWYHNCVTINGQGQIRGNPRERDLGGNSATVGNLVYTHQLNGNYASCMDLASCYQNLPAYSRYVILPSTGTLLVIDEISMDSVSTVTQHWHTLQEVKIVNDTTWKIFNKKRGLNVLIASNTAVKSGAKRDVNTTSIKITNKKPVKEIRIITMFSPYAIKNPELECIYKENELIINVKTKNTSKQIKLVKDGDYYQYLE